jgi:hypothetical protein
LNVNRIVSKFAWIENIETTQIRRYAKKRGTKARLFNYPIRRKGTKPGCSSILPSKKILTKLNKNLKSKQTGYFCEIWVSPL